MEILIKFHLGAEFFPFPVQSVSDPERVFPGCSVYPEASGLSRCHAQLGESAACSIHGDKIHEGKITAEFFAAADSFVIV